MTSPPVITSPVFQIEKGDEIITRNRCGKRVDGRALFLKENFYLQQKTSSKSLTLIRASKSQEFIETIFACFKLGQDILIVPEHLTDEETKALSEKTSANYFLSFKIEKIKPAISFLSYKFKSEKVNMPFSLNLSTKVLFLTSGSTKSKIVVHSLEKLLNASFKSAESLQINSSSKLLLSLPLSHVGGFSIMLRALKGAALCLPESSKLKDISKNIKKFNVSHVSLVPSMLSEFLDTYSKDEFGFLKVALVSGAKISNVLIDKAKEIKLPMILSYGSTESGAMFLHDEGRFLQNGYTKIFDGMEWRAGKKINEEIGTFELEIKGSQMFEGYYGKKSCDFKENWFKTGDIAQKSSSGLQILERLDRLIIKGGENIDPSSLEVLALQVEGVRGAAAVKKASSKWGEVPVLFIEGDSDSLVNKIKEVILEKKKSFFLPEEIKLVKEIPKLSSGKVDYQTLEVIS